MVDFEFRMLGFTCLLDKGHFFEALNSLKKYYNKLKYRKGLIKIPYFINNKEEIEFFINLQNPNTGAFIDGSAPYCTYYDYLKYINQD